MNFHMFLGDSNSSDFQSQLGHLDSVRADSWCDALLKVLSYRGDMSGNWDDEEEEHNDWFNKPFVKYLLAIAKKGTPKTEKGVRSVAKSLLRGEISSPKESEKFAKEALTSMADEDDPFLVVPETTDTLPLLRYLGVAE